jgi:hypothetical protein
MNPAIAPLAEVLPAIAAHVSAMLTHAGVPELPHTALGTVGLEWIKRLIMIALIHI